MKKAPAWFAARGLLFWLSYRARLGTHDFRVMPVHGLRIKSAITAPIHQPNWCKAAFTMLAASTPKKLRNAARVSLRPKPSVPSVM